jgi:hypothetical protein
MKVFRKEIFLMLFSIAVMAVLDTSCKKDENPIKFPYGTFPDSIINLTDINSVFDDYNSTVYEIKGELPILFSSNRKSSGGQFDLEQGKLTYTFSQTTGSFDLKSAITNDVFTSRLISKAITAGNDFGPYRFFSTIDGLEYLILSSVNESGNLDFYYLKNSPVYGSSLPEISGPFPLNLLNSSSDDAYICFDSNLDSIFFSSDRTGKFDIYMHSININKPLSDQLDSVFAESAKQDVFNSDENDKCPYLYKGLMVFASDRVGGLGGYDLYYSELKNGKFSSPKNFGPGINTSSDEYRPVIGSVQDFTNMYMIFSSNRPGGKGGFDLYLTGLNLPK